MYTRAWRSGGTGLFAHELVGGLLDNGAAVTFVAPVAEASRMELPRLGLKRLRPPRETPGKPKFSNIWRGLLRIAASVYFLFSLRVTHRVYIVTIPDVLPVMLPALALLRLSGAKIIFIAHDPLPHAWKLPSAFRLVERGALRTLYTFASAVVVLSEPSRAKMREAFPRLRTPINVIEHGVFVMGDPQPLRGDGTLLLFGTLRENKRILEGMQGVIAARATGVPVRLIVAGGVHREERDYASKLKDCAASAPDAIDLRIGYVDDDALRDLLAQCDAMLLPYADFHSQSGVALLAASNARPIIASDAGGIGALIAEGMPSVTIDQPISATNVAAAVRAFFAVPAESWSAQAQRYLDHTLEVRSWRAIGKNYLEAAGRV